VSLFDFILNLTGVLIWLGWLTRGADPLSRSAPATLAGTVRRAEPVSFKPLHSMLALVALVVLRALFYYQIGPAIDWTPKLDGGLVVLAFRNDRFSAVMLYSVLSFVRLLAGFYFWVLVLLLLNKGRTEAEPVLSLVRLALGPLKRFSTTALMLVLFLVVTALWVGLHSFLARLSVVDAGTTVARTIEQGLLLNVALIMSLKYLVTGLLLAHLAASYVYLGNSPFWDFIHSSARRLLTPVRWVPLRLGRIDFAPLAGVLLALLLLHWGPAYLDGALAKYGIITWPE